MRELSFLVWRKVKDVDYCTVVAASQAVAYRSTDSEINNKKGSLANVAKLAGFDKKERMILVVVLTTIW